MINKKILSNQKGFSIAEIAVAILLLIIFVSLIVTIFNNVYLSFVNSKRNSVATMYATQIAEKIETMLYEEVTDENLTKTTYLQDLNIQDGYHLNIQITPNTENTIKTVDIEVSYIVGNSNNVKKVYLQKIKTRGDDVIPNAPEVYSGMVPVRYDASLNSWIIASAKETNWYNYYNNQWANVMLLDGTTTEEGTQVTEENKEELVGSKVGTVGSMFVWIPRYAYKVVNEEQNTTEIEFLYGSTNSYLDTTTNSTLKDISEKEGYIIPSTFQYKSSENEQEPIQIKGFWVAKYPAGYQESTITIDEYGKENLPTLNELNVKYSDLNYSACNTAYTTNALNQDLSSTQYMNQKISFPVFKPLTYAFNLISIDDAKRISEQVVYESEFYGISSSQINSHMTNNEEWNTVAYLTNSKYGNYNVAFNSKNINNSNNNVYSVTSGFDSNNTSSTNNMSGVFDLNGCIWEFTYNSENNYYIRGGSNIEETGIFGSQSSEGHPNISNGYRVIIIAGVSSEKIERVNLIKSTYSWTSQDIIVTLSYNNIPNGYELQYKVGDNQWTTGTEVTVTNNTNVQGRLYNSTTKDVIGNNNIIVNNIDKENPIKPTNLQIEEIGTNLMVKAIGGSDALSGVEGYQYRLNNTEWSDTVSIDEMFSFSNLELGVTYTVYARTVDKVGLTSDTYSRDIMLNVPVTQITLSDETLTKTGTTNPTITITPTVTPTNATNKSVTWKSSNTSVATINSDGVVTYVGTGTTTITCTAQDGSGVYGTCTVTCSANISVTKITLSNKTLTKTSSTNPTVTLTPTITPTNATNQAFTWKSSNTSVATVNSNGVVTYVGLGKATITCTAQDGSGVKGTCTVTCQYKDTNTYSVSFSDNRSQIETITRTIDIPLDLTGISKVSFEYYGGVMISGSTFLGTHTLTHYVGSTSKNTLDLGDSGDGTGAHYWVTKTMTITGGASTSKLQLKAVGTTEPTWYYVAFDARIRNITLIP